MILLLLFLPLPRHDLLAPPQEQLTAVELLPESPAPPEADVPAADPFADVQPSLTAVEAGERGTYAQQSGL